MPAPDLSRTTARPFADVLRRSGIKLAHVHGAHHYLRRPGGRIVPVPVYPGEVLPRQTVRSILRLAEMTDDEFVRAAART